MIHRHVRQAYIHTRSCHRFSTSAFNIFPNLSGNGTDFDSIENHIKNGDTNEALSLLKSSSDINSIKYLNAVTSLLRSCSNQRLDSSLREEIYTLYDSINGFIVPSLPNITSLLKIAHQTPEEKADRECMEKYQTLLASIELGDNQEEDIESLLSYAESLLPVSLSADRLNHLDNVLHMLFDVLNRTTMENHESLMEKRNKFLHLTRFGLKIAVTLRSTDLSTDFFKLIKDMNKIMNQRVPVDIYRSMLVAYEMADVSSLISSDKNMIKMEEITHENISSFLMDDFESINLDHFFWDQFRAKAQGSQSDYMQQRNSEIRFKLYKNLLSEMYHEFVHSNDSEKIQVKNVLDVYVFNRILNSLVSTRASNFQIREIFKWMKKFHVLPNEQSYANLLITSPNIVVLKRLLHDMQYKSPFPITSTTYESAMTRLSLLSVPSSSASCNVNRITRAQQKLIAKLLKQISESMDEHNIRPSIRYLRTKMKIAARCGKYQEIMESLKQAEEFFNERDLHLKKSDTSEDETKTWLDVDEDLLLLTPLQRKQRLFYEAIDLLPEYFAFYYPIDEDIRKWQSCSKFSRSKQHKIWKSMEVYVENILDILQSFSTDSSNSRVDTSIITHLIAAYSKCAKVIGLRDVKSEILQERILHRNAALIDLMLRQRNESTTEIPETIDEVTKKEENIENTTTNDSSILEVLSQNSKLSTVKAGEYALTSAFRTCVRLHCLTEAENILECKLKYQYPWHASDYSGLIYLYCHAQKLDDALELLQKMHNKGIAPTPRTLHNIIRCQILISDIRDTKQRQLEKNLNENEQEQARLLTMKDENEHYIDEIEEEKMKQEMLEASLLDDGSINLSDTITFFQDWYNLHHIEPRGETVMLIMNQCLKLQNYHELNRFMSICKYIQFNSITRTYIEKIQMKYQQYLQN